MVKPNTEPNVTQDYQTQYDDYWLSHDRIGESSGDLDRVAEQILSTCGSGRTLDIGSGEGFLVASLLRKGIDAHGIDVSEVVTLRANQRLPDRFTHGSVLSLPFADASFQTVVSTDCMEHLAPEDVPKALREIHRVAGGYVYLQIATTQDRDDHWHLTVEGRAWWEKKCLEAGFRKHPAYYKINDYESLNYDGWQILILLEKISQIALENYPLVSLNEERGLHMDMLRDTGERSDAHIFRYQLACNYIKEGDRVLDAACGLGYGSHVIRNLTKAAKVVGVDGSKYAVDYATRSFLGHAVDIEYQLGMLPDLLLSYEAGSFDVIISFETMEHVASPQSLLSEFNRLLTPGGRVIVSVPNDWSDETGEDPNPYHLHVYNWGRLKAELSEKLILEDAYAQTASQCKVAGKGGAWERRPRSLKQVALSEHPPEDCEWWLMTAMKSPLENTLPYEERVFANIAATGHPSIRYSEFFANPWLMYAMVNSSYRLKNNEALEDLALNVMTSSPKNSNDYAAALCVMAYRILDQRLQDSARVDKIISKIDAVTSNTINDLMGLRWKVSLLFIKAKLLQSLGHLRLAISTFVECASLDVRSFGIHLATKSTEAWFTAGKIAHAIGNPEEAQSYWEHGIDIGSALLSVSIDDILINRSFPNRFNNGDGVREYTLAWDNIARCANGLHILKQGGQFVETELDSCFQSEYSTVTRDLLQCRSDLLGSTEDLVETRQALTERTARLEQSNADLLDRTRDLVETREVLQERSALLEQTSAELLGRTEELLDTRQALTERTARLDQSNADLLDRTRDLVETREVLEERSALLEQTSAELLGRTVELLDTRQALTERTARLVQSNADLLDRTRDLVETRKILKEVLSSPLRFGFKKTYGKLINKLKNGKEL